MKFSGIFGLACGMTLLASAAAFAADLPKASDIYPKMGLGWNLGNTMEVPSDQGGPTGWGNIVPTAEIINGVKAAGFTTLRIPCAWDSHASNGTIDASWLETVKSVVDMAIANDMYVMLNSHWDNGWLEDEVFSGEHVDRNGQKTTTDSSKVRALQEKYWEQIATYFKDYDEHLLFASANEPGVNDHRGGTPASDYTDNGQLTFINERMIILKRLHEAFLRAVRKTGGNNATRTVIVQMPRTEIDKFQMLANNYPEDPAGKGYTMVEAHFYPYQFSLMTKDEDWGKTFWYWEGETTGNADRTCSGTTLGSKQSIDNQFKKLQVTFADEGIPVVIGEMGANKRYSLVGTEGFDLDTHLKAIAAWYGYTVASAKSHGIVPVIWDTAYEGKNDGKDDMTIIRRQASNGDNLGAVVDELTMNAIKTQFAAATPYAGPKPEQTYAETDKALWVQYKTKVSNKSETGTIRFNFEGGVDWTAYESISFEIRTEPVHVEGCVGDPDNGCNGYAWTSVDMFAMSTSGSKWTDYHLGSMDDYSGFLSTVSVPLAVGTEKSKEVLNIADMSKVTAWGINIYATQLTGTIYLNNILLHKADGSVDTLASFDKAPANMIVDGIAGTPSYIQANAKGTGGPVPTVSIAPIRTAATSKMLVNVQNGVVSASFTAAKTAPAKAVLLNSMGQVIAQESFMANKGMNSVELRNSYRGPAMLMVKQGSQRYVQKVILK